MTAYREDVRTDGDDTVLDTEQALDRLSRQLRTLADEVDGPLHRVRLSAGDLVVEVEWEHPAPVLVATAPAVTAAPLAPAPVPTAPPTTAPTTASATADTAPTDDPHGGTVAVTSPMVGTFYHCPGPGEPPFVEVGQRIEVGHTVGIVEAMKLLNPIESDVAGEIVEITVADAQAVEFDQPLVRVRPVTDGG